jgi:hypothetical protein
MKILITRPVVLTSDGGTRAFVPGLTVEVDAVTAEQILAPQAGIAVEPIANAEAPATARRRKSADAET